MHQIQQAVTGRACTLSDCMSYRYALEERWGPGGLVAFICHNPSTATDTQADHTFSRMRNFVRKWGYGALVVGNRFAGGRSPTVQKLDHMADPIGPENDWHIARIAERADLIVLAWGNLPCPPERTEAVIKILAAAGKPLHCLGRTNSGNPKHPSARGRASIPRDAQPIPWMPAK